MLHQTGLSLAQSLQNAGLLARSQYPEGPATATSAQVFLGFPLTIR
jgi:hypothetical protein